MNKNCPYQVKSEIKQGYSCTSPLRVGKEGESFECDPYKIKECIWGPIKLSLLERLSAKRIWNDFDKRQRERRNFHAG